MRKLLVVFCTLLVMGISMEAKAKRKLPASQNSADSKSAKARAKTLQKARKAPKHRQRVN